MKSDSDYIIIGITALAMYYVWQHKTPKLPTIGPGGTGTGQPGGPVPGATGTGTTPGDSTDVHWIDCNDPNADQTLCAQIQQSQAPPQQ